ncbi:hypothetical protein OIU74_008654 [Salix koriyanagi]|uniref:Legume lectin domain-containing protein n=1 Tax=Salix koriyanagi TaxID=2511006 RepID=A0A9Q0TQF8_9ROSI|nr:hypothetical protein OIU74_008654 [Salix koriyanagi]
MSLWIDYDEVERLLNVTVAPITSTKPAMPLLSTSLDLSSVMLDSMYVGFSSSTGAVASSHYILGWSFNRSGQAQSLDVSKLPSLPPQRKSRRKPYLRIAVPAIAAIILLLAISGAAYIIRRKTYEELREDWEQEYGPQRFSYKDLYIATKGFAYRELLGKVTRTGKSTTSSDVFSFGTFMLEVACGRKPVESEKPPDEVVLVDWVFECWKRGAVLGTVDPRLEGNSAEEEMEFVLKLGLLCTHRTPSARPSMRQVVQYLDGNATLPDLPLQGTGIGLVPVSSEASGEHVLTIPISSEHISSCNLSESILSGR